RCLSLQLVLGEAHDRRELAQEPTVDLRTFVHVLDRGPPTERREKTPESIVRGAGRQESIEERRGLGDLHPRWRLPQETLTLDLERAERLLHRRLERAIDGHHLAGRLHLRPERAIRTWELVEGPA